MTLTPEVNFGRFVFETFGRCELLFDCQLYLFLLSERGLEFYSCTKFFSPGVNFGRFVFETFGRCELLFDCQLCLFLLSERGLGFYSCTIVF
jgi:hypothetical protein